jgi:hypothetical protein
MVNNFTKINKMNTILSQDEHYSLTRWTVFSHFKSPNTKLQIGAVSAHNTFKS